MIFLRTGSQTPRLQSIEYQGPILDGFFELEKFRKYLEDLRTKAEEVRRLSPLELALYSEIISTYNAGMAMYKGAMARKSTDGASYFCKFEELKPSVTCLEQGKSEPVFNFGVQATQEFINLVRNKNEMQTKVRMTPVGAEQLRQELETFRRSLEEMRTKAEDLRGRNLRLYREVISMYSMGVSLYSDAMELCRGKAAAGV